MNDKFEALKEEILKRARKANACREQYGRAYKAETIAELLTVVKDNFNWAFNKKVLTADLIEKYREDFAENDIYLNVSVNSGFLICDSATVEACGSATVRAYDSATVEACDSATVRAYDSATVEACGSATVRAYGSATVRAYGSATVEACGSATVRAYGSATVRAYDSATVEAYGSAYVQSYSIIECKLSDNAIHRVCSTNTLYFVSDTIKFEKINPE